MIRKESQELLKEIASLCNQASEEIEDTDNTNEILCLCDKLVEKIDDLEEEEQTLLLATRICDHLSDGYDDEEYRKEGEETLYKELKKLNNSNILKSTFENLCDRIDDLEFIKEASKN